MGGFWKFIVGGIIGGVVGFFVAPRRAIKERPALPMRERPQHSLAVPQPQGLEPGRPLGGAEAVATAAAVAEVPIEEIPTEMAPEPEEHGVEEAPAEYLGVKALEDEAFEEEALQEEAPVEEAAAALAREAEVAAAAEAAALEARIEATKRRLREAQEMLAEAAEPVEPVAAEPTAPEPEPQAVPAGEAPDELKSRIEETRLRIKEELERSFADVEQTTVGSDGAGAPSVEMAQVEPAGPASLPEETVAAMAAAAPAEVQPTAESPSIDFETMRRRIEQTRSRLKAKAFDAMMSGETAFLDRSETPLDGQPVLKPTVDSEVDETVEAGLAEEEY